MDIPLPAFEADFMDPDRVPLALGAILVCLVIGSISGPLAGNANPFLWLVFDKLFGSLGDRLDKKHRARADLVFRGFVLSVLAVFAALLLTRLIEYIAFSAGYTGIAEIVVVCLSITAGAVWFTILRLYFAFEGKKLVKGAYYAVVRTTRTDLSRSDDYGITRAAMGFAARSFDKGMVAPVFWYLLVGPAAALVYATLAALSWRFGKDGFTKGFGAVPLALERLMGFVPSLLSALLLALAALFTPSAKTHKGLAAWLGHKNRASYEQGGFALSALAWSLGVSLGGPVQDLTGSAIKNEWVGPKGATAKVSHKHLRHAIYITAMAQLLFLLALGSAYLWASRTGFPWNLENLSALLS